MYLFCSVLDKNELKLFQILENFRLELLYSTNGDESSIGKLSYFDNKLYMIARDKLIELDISTHASTVLPSPYGTTVLTDIIQTDGGSLVVAGNLNKIYYLNPFGEFFPFKQDLKLPYPTAVPFQIRPPALKYIASMREFPAVIINTDKGHSWSERSLKEALFLLYASCFGTKKQVILVNNLGQIDILADLDLGVPVGRTREVYTEKKVWIGTQIPITIVEFPSPVCPTGYLAISKEIDSMSWLNNQFIVQRFTWKNQGLPTECFRFLLPKSMVPLSVVGVPN